MNGRALLLLLVAVALAAAASARDAARIKSLPGWTVREHVERLVAAHSLWRQGALPSAQYSGLMDIGAPPSGVGTMYIHWVSASFFPHCSP